jgi:hypothetical protein
LDQDALSFISVVGLALAFALRALFVLGAFAGLAVAVFGIALFARGHTFLGAVAAFACESGRSQERGCGQKSQG